MKILANKSVYFAALVFLCPMAQAATLKPGVPVPIDHVQKVVAGGYFACALQRVPGSPGSVTCWGDNGSGQLGRGNFGSSYAYADSVHGLGDVIDLSAGFDHACALEKSGSVKCWGYNGDGELGNGDDTLTNQSSPTPLHNSLVGAVTSIQAGSFHTCAIAGDSAEVYCWGYNGLGQLGQRGLPPVVNAPVRASSLVGALQLAAGSHTCARFAEGGVFCWGDNDSGQLGDGTTRGGPDPVQTFTLGAADNLRATQLTAGYQHTCALTNGSGEFCWGDNTYGEVGNNRSGTIEKSPFAVATLPAEVRTIASGSRTSCASLIDGTAYCWGQNSAGQLGNGTTMDTPVPAIVTFASMPLPGEGVTSIALSKVVNGFGCAAIDHGRVQCWGSNAYGQLGDGANSSRLYPATYVVEDDRIFANDFQ